MTTAASKVAFVTGSASGIGESIARRLSLEGLLVAVADRDEERGKAVSESLPGSVFVPVDVTSMASVTKAVDSVTDELGPIGILVNCAGGDVVKPFVETDESLWYDLVELNFLGVLRCTRAVLPGMIERSAGRIVSIASDAGRVGSSGEAVYAGCKGGVIAFMKTVAREVARYGVTANTVCPGPTATPPVTKMLSEGSERYIEALKRSIPMRRLGEPEDIAAAVEYLVSDGAGYVTGQTLSVNGGLSMS
jgi:2-hydroxycyclohexanecarboxyl-CoA dehydrogenase